MSQEAMKQALEALKDNQHLVADNERHAYVMEYNAIIEKLEEALANHCEDNLNMVKQEQGEPVAMQMDVIVVNLVREGINKHRARELAQHFINHTTPYVPTGRQQRTWVGLDPEEIRKTNHHMVEGAYHYSFKQGAEWAEAKLREKNSL